MTALFTGMTALLAGTFGDPVLFRPRSGAPREIQSIFREAPIEVTGADGQAVLIEAPTWRVSRDLAPELRRRDLIEVSDGRVFRVEVVHPPASPSPDAFFTCELHHVSGGDAP